MSAQAPPAAHHAAANLEAFARQHRNALLAAGGAGVVGVAYLMRRRGAAADSGPTATTASPVGQPADPYASTAYDVYDALQPQLEQGLGNLQTELDALTGREDARDAADAARKATHSGKPKTAHRKTRKPAPARKGAHQHKVPAPSPKKPVKSSRRKTGGWGPRGVVQPKKGTNPRKPKAPAATVRKAAARKAAPRQPTRRR